MQRTVFELPRLPQLAVLAKILCLLMVVMCGAVPSTVRSVSLYSTCSRGNVTVVGRTVKSTVRNEHNAPFQKMTTQSDDLSNTDGRLKLYLFAEKSKRYICFTKRWKIVSLPKKKRDEWCQFEEKYHGRYLRYQSAKDPSRFIGFNRNGKPIVSPRGRPECYNFIKLHAVPGVERHNDIISGGNKHRELLRSALLAPSPASPASTLGGASRKSRPQHQNALLSADRSSSSSSSSGSSGSGSSSSSSGSSSSSSSGSSSSSRLSQLATQHRLRHWNKMREDATRRRHESRATSKY